MMISLAFLIVQALVLWVFSLRLKDSSLMDRFWASSFVVIMFILFLQTEKTIGTSVLLGIMTLWGVRLSYHITRRNWGKGEDPRYFAIRQSTPGYPWKSLFMIFIFQGGLVAVISLPLWTYASGESHHAFGWTEILGLLIWGLGLWTEATADQQLKAFKEDRSPEKKEVMDRGLWGLSRHPNYLGDAIVWWGFWVYTFSVGDAWTIVSPILMTWLLRYFTGVEHLERYMLKTKATYPEYVERVPVFWPKPLGRPGS